MVTFYSFWKNELADEAIRSGLSAFRGFEAEHINDLTSIAAHLLDTSIASGMIGFRQLLRPWHQLAEPKSLAVPAMHAILDRVLQSERELVSTPSIATDHEFAGVDAAWSFLKKHRDIQLDSPARSLVCSFLRGQKPAPALLQTHQLKFLRNSMTERNAEHFLQAFLNGVRPYCGKGPILIWQQSDPWVDQNSVYQQLKLVAVATAIRRWIDWSVQMTGNGVVVCFLLERTLWNALMRVYPPLQQRISELRRPPNEPYRSPLQYGKHLQVLDVSIVNPEGGTQLWNQQPDQNGKRESRRLIDALRMGLVPVSGRESMTVGIEQIHRWLQSNLQKNQYIDGNTYTLTMDAIAGSYGSGKSHFLSVFRDWYTQQGWLTAWTELDGKWCSWSDPLTWLRTLVRSLPISLWSLWKRARRFTNELSNEKASHRHPAKQCALFLAFEKLSSIDEEDAEQWANRMIGVVLADGANWQDEELQTWQQIASKSYLTNVRPWVGRTIEKRAEELREAIEACAWLVTEAGYKGLWIAVDECDQEARSSQSNPDWRQRQRESLQGLIRANGSIRLTLATVPPSVNPDPFLLEIQEVVRNQAGETYELPTYSFEERLQLAELIYQHYQQAYQFQRPFNPHLVKEFDRFLLKHRDGGMDIIRIFIKWYVHFLDTAFGPKANM